MNFFKRQSIQIKKEGWRVYFIRKFILSWRVFSYFILHLPFYIIAIPVVLIIRIIRPWLLIRFECLHSRIGYFAGNVELYLCERDAGINTPKGAKRYVDFFCLQYIFSTHYKRYLNMYLLSKWKELLYIFPELIVAPVRRINRFLPGWKVHEIGQNDSYERDVHNLLMRYPTHIKFLPKEEKNGSIGLERLGIPKGKPFVCLLVRDAAYYEKQLRIYGDSSAERDSNIDNYILAIEELVKYGYYVVRMGVVVEKPLKIDHPRIIDYAWKGLRSEFMDVYLGAKCDFCISTGSGWDAVPYIFRRPIVFTNAIPLGRMITFAENYITIPKKYRDIKTGEDINLREVFHRGFGLFRAPNIFLGDCFEKSGIELVENTPEEIRNVLVEMIERLHGTWQETEEDEELQRRFWKTFPVDIRDSLGQRLHGKIYGRIGRNYLRDNSWLLE